MRARLRLLFANDAPEGDPSHFRPEDPEFFGLWVQAFIGKEDDEAFDSFDFLVCSPSWFAGQFDSRMVRQHEARPGFRWGRGLVFLKRWDFQIVDEAVREVCAKADGPNWGVVASRISRLLPWEFEYRYDDALDLGRPFPAAL